MAFPTPFGRYVLLQKLATGGMAELFLARSLGEWGFRKTCVIKRVLPHLAANRAFVEMFLDEARLAAQLNHPGIVQIFDLGRNGDDYYLAMEYLAGEDVEALIRRAATRARPVPAPIAARIVASAADALHFAHQLRTEGGRPLSLVHRDISPMNLMVTYQGVTKILDFGIALAAQRLQTTEAGVIKGTAAYMSPEQARGSPVDRRSDIWSLGVCLHELLCGGPLFPRGAAAVTGVAVLQMAIPLPSAARPELPPELDEIVGRALERDPSRRYATADALARDLRAFLTRQAADGGEPSLAQYLRELFGEERAEEVLNLAVAAAPPPRPGTETLDGPIGAASRSPSSQTTRPQRPLNRAWWGAAAGLTVLMLLASGTWWASRTPAPPAPLEAGPAAPPAAKSRSEPEPTGDPSRLEVAAGPLKLWRNKAEMERPGPDLPTSPPASMPAAASRARRGQETHRGTESGSLTVEANLPAQVRLDGVEVGSTPFTRQRVAAGEHVLVVSDTEHGASQTLTLQVSSETEARQSIHFGKGRLNVTANPWADVFLDGQPLGQTPLAGREVWEGRHRLRLSGPDGEKTRTIEIHASEVTVINERFP
jgi:serine/threonine-protein kinase